MLCALWRLIKIIFALSPPKILGQYPVKYRMMFWASLPRGGPVDSYPVNKLMFYRTFELLRNAPTDKFVRLKSSVAPVICQACCRNVWQQLPFVHLPATHTASLFSRSVQLAIPSVLNCIVRVLPARSAAHRGRGGVLRHVPPCRAGMCISVHAIDLQL